MFNFPNDKDSIIRHPDHTVRSSASDHIQSMFDLNDGLSCILCADASASLWLLRIHGRNNDQNQND